MFGRRRTGSPATLRGTKRAMPTFYRSWNIKAYPLLWFRTAAAGGGARMLVILECFGWAKPTASRRRSCRRAA